MFLCPAPRYKMGCSILGESQPAQVSQYKHCRDSMLCQMCEAQDCPFTLVAPAVHATSEVAEPTTLHCRQLQL